MHFYYCTWRRVTLVFIGEVVVGRGWSGTRGLFRGLGWH